MHTQTYLSKTLIRGAAVAALSLSIVLSIALLATPAHAAFGDTKTYISKLYWGDGYGRAKAFFDFPEDITKTSTGEFLIADTGNNVIRKINKDGIVSTFAGSNGWGDKTGSRKSSQFASPAGVAERKGVVIIADTENGKIKRVKNGVVDTIASGLKNPKGVAIYGSTVYFTDTGNNALKKVSINGGKVTQITGSLSAPRKLAISSDGKTAYVANPGTYQIKKVNLSTGAVSTLAGKGNAGKKNGKCESATFQNVFGVHRKGNMLYVTDGNGADDTVRAINLDTCQVSTFASDSNMTSINFPNGLTSKDGNLYVAATGIGIIQKYSIENANINSKYAGANRFNVKNSDPVLVGQPKFLRLSKDKKWIYFSENNRLRKIERSTKKVRLIAGNVVDNYVKGKDTQVRVGENARFSDITSFQVSADGKYIFAVDRNNNRIRKVNIATQEVSYFTGAGGINLAGSQQNDYQDGGACPNEYNTDRSGCAYFNRPTGSAISPTGKYLYVADSGNNRIRKVTLTGENKGQVRTVAGSGSAGFTNGTGTGASFNAPIGLAISPDGKTLYVADRNNHAIRAINLSNRKVTTLAGNGQSGYLDAGFSAARFSLPLWITTDSKGNLYTTEAGTNAVRMLDMGSKTTRTVANNNIKRGFANGAGSTAKFNNPQGLLVIDDKRLYVADRLNDLIRVIDIRR